MKLKRAAGSGRLVTYSERLAKRGGDLQPGVAANLNRRRPSRRMISEHSRAVNISRGAHRLGMACLPLTWLKIGRSRALVACVPDEASCQTSDQRPGLKCTLDDARASARHATDDRHQSSIELAPKARGAAIAGIKAPSPSIARMYPRRRRLGDSITAPPSKSGCEVDDDADGSPYRPCPHSSASRAEIPSRNNHANRTASSLVGATSCAGDPRTYAQRLIRRRRDSLRGE